MHSFTWQVSFDIFVAFGIECFSWIQDLWWKKNSLLWIFVVSFSFVLLNANGVQGSASSQ
jgi:hypothetical protein